MFKEQFNFDFPELDELLASDPVKAERLFTQFSDRIFNARHVGLSSQELQSWEGQGFLPYEYSDTGWRKFSFIEIVWIKCIQKLRSMDVSHKKILFLKDFFFKMEKDEIIKLIEYTPMLIGIGMKKYLVMAELELNDEVYEEAKVFLHEGQYSRFSFLVLWILMFKANACLLIDENDNCKFIILGPQGMENIFNNEVTFSDIQHKSFILLNLKTIVHDFFEDENLEFSNEYLVAFLTEGQKKIMDKIKEGGFSSITIRFDDGGQPTHLEWAKSKITNDVLDKVARYLNKKSFKHIQFKVRDGELITYEEKDIIKL